MIPSPAFPYLHNYLFFLVVDPVIKFADKALKNFDATPAGPSSMAACMAGSSGSDEVQKVTKGGPYKNKKVKNYVVSEEAKPTKRVVDEVSAYLYQLVPKKIKIEDLRKLAFIAQIEKDKSIRLCCDALVNFLPVVKRFLAYSVPEIKPGSC